MVKKSKLPDPDKFKSEFDILRQLDHPNIIKLFEVFEDKKYIYFIMEVCEGGELFERITEKGAFNEEEAKDAFNQIMKAIQYMHHNKICHRDMKPENLLFVKTGDSLLKLIDFGISKTYFDKSNADQTIKMKTRAGSLFYISLSLIHI